MTSAAAIAPIQTKMVPNRCQMLSILLPVRNEGINLRIMLKILRAVVDLPHEVLVVYDSTGDDSIAVYAMLSSLRVGMTQHWQRQGDSCPSFPRPCSGRSSCDPSPKPDGRVRLLR